MQSVIQLERRRRAHLLARMKLLHQEKQRLETLWRLSDMSSMKSEHHAPSAENHAPSTASPDMECSFSSSQTSDSSAVSLCRQTSTDSDGFCSQDSQYSESSQDDVPDLIPGPGGRGDSEDQLKTRCAIKIEVMEEEEAASLDGYTQMVDSGNESDEGDVQVLGNAVSFVEEITGPSVARIIGDPTKLAEYIENRHPEPQ